MRKFLSSSTSNLQNPVILTRSSKRENATSAAADAKEEIKEAVTHKKDNFSLELKPGAS